MRRRSFRGRVASLKKPLSGQPATNEKQEKFFAYILSMHSFHASFVTSDLLLFAVVAVRCVVQDFFISSSRSLSRLCFSI